MKLTAATIRRLSLPAGKSEATVPDERLRAFRLRLRSGGAKSLYVRYRGPDGNPIKHTFGPEALLDPERALAQAKDLLARVRLGADPRAEKNEARRKAGETFGGRLHEYLALQRLLLRPRSFTENRRHLEVIAEPLHGLALTAIEPADVSELVNKAAAERGRTAAKHLAQSLNAFSLWCVERGYTDRHFAGLGKKERRALQTRARERVLADHELRLILAALRDDRFSQILRLLLRLGLRRSEVADLRWSEVDLNAQTLKLPAARVKNDEPRTVLLPHQVAAILAARQREAGAELVFGDPGSRGFQNWTGKLALDARVAELNGGRPLAHWLLHDFRRAAAAWLGEKAGTPPHIIDLLLGHRIGSKVTLTYNRARYLEEQHTALQLWNDHLDELVGTPQSAHVVKLKKRK